MPVSPFTLFPPPPPLPSSSSFSRRKIPFNNSSVDSVPEKSLTQNWHILLAWGQLDVSSRKHLPLYPFILLFCPLFFLHVFR